MDRNSRLSGDSRARTLARTWALEVQEIKDKGHNPLKIHGNSSCMLARLAESDSFVNLIIQHHPTYRHRMSSNVQQHHGAQRHTWHTWHVTMVPHVLRSSILKPQNSGATETKTWESWKTTHSLTKLSVYHSLSDCWKQWSFPNALQHEEEILRSLKCRRFRGSKRLEYFLPMSCNCSPGAVAPTLMEDLAAYVCNLLWLFLDSRWFHHFQ